jgi:hypothetical protein
MTKLLSLLPNRAAAARERLLPWTADPHEHSSLVRFESAALPGVDVTIRRMTLGRRIELARQVRELAGRLEFHQAGQSMADKIDAAALNAEIDAIYLRWGLVSVIGFNIDGLPATSDTVISGAPEGFAAEIVERIKRECGVSEQERKN